MPHPDSFEITKLITKYTSINFDQKKSNFFLIFIYGNILVYVRQYKPLMMFKIKKLLHCNFKEDVKKMLDLSTGSVRRDMSYIRLSNH